jgi:hypothetical protein
MIPQFNIFSGTFHRNGCKSWLDWENDLDKAQEKMIAMANTNPGPYFIFSMAEHKVISEIDASQEPTRWKIYS